MLLLARLPRAAVPLEPVAVVPQNGAPLLATPAGVATPIQEVGLLIPAGPGRQVAAPEAPRPTVAAVGGRPRRRVAPLLAGAFAPSPGAALNALRRRDALLAAPLPLLNVAARVPPLPARRLPRPTPAAHPLAKVLAGPIPTRRDGRAAEGPMLGEATTRGGAS